ncbi:carcinoembryonic antigen-related cell adhesion molecule 2-like [Pomacea canaliculata]|uniref:carcinoembryonic antigen-related cell adhesion molecule 2-like n=1 Tax=Pomacea canaliculata TaxID=400727 RepID=UPI000D7373D9|nr:carcinoembryonic antigen-related cell adhesion molecule 2-like [Pomacea canaliculata]XP_025102886.1 carcinoembryonic antigen-related cell adhesion molecule 2-like [Pomacea canaliculata]XP_025102887.1 carcinoembryonic antigen-related cell adhesion molecule 2-like [Pomacea canaliculata]
MTDSNCAGDEANIIACTQRITGYFPSCPKSREFGVICSDSNPGLYILLENNGTNEAFPPFEGTNVSLKCESTRQIELEANYTWPETAGGRPYGKYLIFDNVTRAHSKRRVKCGATYIKDGRREVVSSDPITMQVYYKPVIRILSDTSTCEPHASPSNTCYITKGQNVNLVCEAESNPIPALFQWSEKYISNSKKLQILSAHVSKHDCRYRCTVSTTIHDESDSRLPLSSSYLFTVIVQEPPAVLSFTANDEHNTTMMVDENSNVSLSCEAAGRPTPSMILKATQTAVN